MLRATERAAQVAEALLEAQALPRNASRDALHVGICAVYGVSFLLTWNFRHLANARMQDHIREACYASGFACPTICSPEALFEDEP
jgi:hypothetical protein